MPSPLLPALNLKRGEGQLGTKGAHTELMVYVPKALFKGPLSPIVGVDPEKYEPGVHKATTRDLFNAMAENGVERFAYAKDGSYAGILCPQLSDGEILVPGLPALNLKSGKGEPGDELIVYVPEVFALQDKSGVHKATRDLFDAMAEKGVERFAYAKDLDYGGILCPQLSNGQILVPGGRLLGQLHRVKK